METQLKALESLYASRRKKLLNQIRGEAALIPASPVVRSSRDMDFPYRPDSNFFYLTGIEESHAALLLLGGSKGARSILYLQERDAAKEVWTGARIGLKRAKRRFEVDEVRDYSELKADLPKSLSESSALHYPLGTHPELDAVVFDLMKSHIAPRTTFPNVLKDARVLLAEMRFIKDRHEISAIRNAVEITALGIRDTALELPKLGSEIHAAAFLEQKFARHGANGIGFSTIIAGGKNATVLHHTPTHQPLWKRELVLIDAGALFRGYGGDISRTYPVSGKFTKPQAEVYDVVCNALQTAIRRVKPGVTLDIIHATAVKEIVSGLIALKILKGEPNKHINSGSYKRYYMHRSGHWLGLDTHDISPLPLTKPHNGNTSYNRPVVPGNIFTIEPGLYFAPTDTTVRKPFRGIGVRLEEDVLVTENGCEVLSKSLPVERQAVEEMF